MAYIDIDYYSNFGGNEIPEKEFTRIAEIASDIIDSIVIGQIDKENEEQFALIQKATAYQAEMLYEQGGVDSIVGYAGSISFSSESLGGYSISNGNGTQTQIKTKDGLPISALVLALLKKAGLMKRWAYSEQWRKRNGK